jgi:hypothetical protein
MLKVNKVYFIVKFIFFIVIILVIKIENNFLKQKRVLYSNRLKQDTIINLTTLPNYNKKILPMEKNELLKFISKSVGKKIRSVKSIFIGNYLRFGNKLILIYKVIFYCQILRCKKVFLDKTDTWFIKRKIINKKYKMIIVPEEEKNLYNYKTIIDSTDNFYYYKRYIKAQKRIDLLKNEILRNLPKISTNPNDIFIYIRSGDIFIRPHQSYSQAPLCFYNKILDNYIFRKYYLIAQDKNNPVIKKLLEIKPNIIYNYNSLYIDIAYLANAYNLVGGKISTFLDGIIPLNNNLRNIWLFNLQTQKDSKKNKNQYLNIKANVFVMNASSKYSYNMKYWSNNKFQRNLMINEICVNDFKMFPPIN